MSTELDLIATRPAAHRSDLPSIKAEWQGRRVAVRYIKHRGSTHRRTQMGWAWGSLVIADRTDQIAVRTTEGVKNIDYRRVTAVYDLTRTLAQPSKVVEGAACQQPVLRLAPAHPEDRPYLIETPCGTVLGSAGRCPTSHEHAEAQTETPEVPRPREAREDTYPGESMMNPSWEYRVERARGAGSHWGAIRELHRAYND